MARIERETIRTPPILGVLLILRQTHRHTDTQMHLHLTTQSCATPSACELGDFTSGDLAIEDYAIGFATVDH